MAGVPCRASALMGGVGLLAGRVATRRRIYVENTTRAQGAEDAHRASFNANGREPGHGREEASSRISSMKRCSRGGYLREHPEIENDTRYRASALWRQVTIGSTKGEVRILLEEPDQRTIDPALMARLPAALDAGPDQGKEAWVYRSAGSSTWTTRSCQHDSRARIQGQDDDQ